MRSGASASNCSMIFTSGFFRLAEKRIAEVGGRGVVCFISNYSWLEGLSHPVMRERLATNFDVVWIDNCNGDKYKTGKRTPDGRPDESMFTTDDHRVGIQVGTAIASLVKKGTQTANGSAKRDAARVYYREFWGTGNAKRCALLDSLDEGNNRWGRISTFLAEPLISMGVHANCR